MKRHANIKNIEEIESISMKSQKKFEFTRKRLAASTGAIEIGCSWFELPPGKQAFPHHYHFANEEAFYILSGAGEFRIGDEKYPVSAGDYISCPAGDQHGHSLLNTGSEPLRYLGISTALSTDVVVYPDSKKLGIAAGADMHKGLKNAKLTKLIKDQPNVDYFLDEE